LRIRVKMGYIKLLKFLRWNLLAKTVGYSSFVRCLTVRCAKYRSIFPPQQHTGEVRRNVTGLTVIKFSAEGYVHANHLLDVTCYFISLLVCSTCFGH